MGAACAACVEAHGHQIYSDALSGALDEDKGNFEPVSAGLQSTSSSSRGSDIRAMQKGETGADYRLRPTKHYPMLCVPVHYLMLQEQMPSWEDVHSMNAIIDPPDDVVVHFVSHQWLGSTVADPNGVHLSRLQGVFNEVLAGRGKSLFTNADWSSYLKGPYAGLETGSFEDRPHHTVPIPRSEDDFMYDVEQGYVWSDCWSVPQLRDLKADLHFTLAGITFFQDIDDADVFRDLGFPCTGEILTDVHIACVGVANVDALVAEGFLAWSVPKESLKLRRTDNKRAIDSIPYYVERCDYFWILAPTTYHADTGAKCDLASWRRRAWCRLEEWSTLLAVKPKTTLVITDSPHLAILGLMDSAFSKFGCTDRAPCTGELACCEMGHQISLAHGDCVVHFPCDKPNISAVLEQLYNAKMASVYATKHKLLHATLVKLGTTIFAGSDVVPPDPMSEKTIDNFLGNWTLFSDLDDSDSTVGNVLYSFALFANPMLVQQVVEMRPQFLHSRNGIGITPIMVACQRPDRLLNDMLDGLESQSESIVSFTSGVGITALEVAAAAGFHEHVKTLLQHKADSESRCLDTGRTPLLSACLSLHPRCCHELLLARANVNAQTSGRATGLHLAVEKPFALHGNHDENAQQAVIDELLFFRADLEITDAQGRTPLHVALELGDRTLLEMLRYEVI